MKRRVADIIMDTLLEYGINTCFAVVGGGAMHLDNALLVCEKMNKIFNHHEQACSMAADAYARYSGRMAAVCVTSGPGATNAITGVMGAWQDSIPMIVLSGQVRYAVSIPQCGLKLRYRGIQEFEIIPTVKNMTKYAKMITDPLEIKRELVKAINIAMDGRRGPVWLDIPQDIQNAIVEEEQLYSVEEYVSILSKPSKDLFDEMVKIINESQRPCLLIGSGIISSGNRDCFIEVSKKIGIPIIGGAWVSDNLYREHDMYFGSAGNIGPRTGNLILQNADTIISIGNSLGYRQTGFNQNDFAPNAKVVMIDADEEEAKKPGLNIYRFIHSDIIDILEYLNEEYSKIKVESKWKEYCRTLKERFSPYEAIDNIDMSDRVCSYWFWNRFAKYEEDDSILALGNNTGSSAKLQIGTEKEQQRVLTNYTCGSMGFDLPAAIGAAVASKKKVYCVTGDGSIMMNLQELQTIVQYDLPVNVVVFSNDGYGAIRQTSKNFFQGKYIGCTPDTGVSFPEFKEVAEVFGFSYIKCNTNEEVEECIKQMVASDKRVLLELSQRFDDPIIPKVMSRIDKNGVMQSPALHDMYPFLDYKELQQLMIRNNIEENSYE